jgi:hypothetical protein
VWPLVNPASEHLFLKIYSSPTRPRQPGPKKILIIGGTLITTSWPTVETAIRLPSRIPVGEKMKVVVVWRIFPAFLVGTPITSGWTYWHFPEKSKIPEAVLRVVPNSYLSPLRFKLWKSAEQTSDMFTDPVAKRRIRNLKKLCGETTKRRWSLRLCKLSSTAAALFSSLSTRTQMNGGYDAGVGGSALSILT